MTTDATPPAGRRLAVITGGAGGIGRGFCEELLAEGWQVALVDRDRPAIDAALAALDAGDAASGHACDVTDEAAVHALARDIIGSQGAPDLLVNSAGLLLRGVPASQITTAAWQRILGVNLFGIIHTVQAFLPAMRERGLPARIVNVGSISGFAAGFREIGAYATSKFAVIGYTEALEAELRDTPVSVCVLVPAAVSTDFYVTSARHDPDLDLPGRITDTPADTAAGMKPRALARYCLDATEAARPLYIMSHPETRPMLEDRFAQVLASFD